jgi:hypothetical protein
MFNKIIEVAYNIKMKSRKLIKGSKIMQIEIIVLTIYCKRVILIH